jgi:peptidoglycan/LPS O-acetylase OafA/YrhL
VTRNGVLLMGLAAFLMMIVTTRGSVDLLVIFYSINVFITFSLSQAGMVRHWWQERANDNQWVRKLAINGFGLVLTASILVSLTIVKFNEGGWATLLVTGVLVIAAFGIKRHYNGVGCSSSASTPSSRPPRPRRGRSRTLRPSPTRRRGPP